MNRDNLLWGPAPAPDITWSEADVPVSTPFDDVYYNRVDGIAESRLVFLTGNQLPERWQQHPPDERFCIAETGFGTGLNFLLTCQEWLAHAAPKPDLHFISLEKYPLSGADLTKALAKWPQLADIANELIRQWPGRLAGQHRLFFAHGRITLDLWWEDAIEGLQDLAQREAIVDAWYLDGFTPSRNEAMWRPPLYDAMAALSRQGATAATFTAAGHVRRGLLGAGFEVTKAEGYGLKRERMQATYTGFSGPIPSENTPWDLAEAPLGAPATAIVVGGGLAGCAVASALARRGVKVTLLEADGLAEQGSGNEQGILYTRLSRRHSPLTDFALQSFRFAASYYQQLLTSGALEAGVDGQLNGSFHQQLDEEEMAILQAPLNALAELAQVMTPEAANQVLGVTPAHSGYWFPLSGWLRPPAVCKTLTAHRNINVKENVGGVELVQSSNGWTARCASGETIDAPCAIIATGTTASAMAELEWLPLQKIRGQTTHIPATEVSLQLQAGFCHTGYIAPATEATRTAAPMHCIGATFNLKDSDTSQRDEDHQTNINKLAAAIPAWAPTLNALAIEDLKGRVGFRCASPDYLPIAGAVPNHQQFLHNYAGLRKNAKAHIEKRGDYIPGLFVSTAHGSRGLTSTPLVAEMLASQICHEPMPLSRELCRALSPSRFLIRDLSRNRI